MKNINYYLCSEIVEPNPRQYCKVWFYSLGNLIEAPEKYISQIYFSRQNTPFIPKVLELELLQKDIIYQIKFDSEQFDTDLFQYRQLVELRRVELLRDLFTENGFQQNSNIATLIWSKCDSENLAEKIEQFKQRVIEYAV